MVCIYIEASISKLVLVPQRIQYQSIMARKFHQIIHSKSPCKTQNSFCKWSILCDDERILLFFCWCLCHSAIGLHYMRLDVQI